MSSRVPSLPSAKPQCAQALLILCTDTSGEHPDSAQVCCERRCHIRHTGICPRGDGEDHQPLHVLISVNHGFSVAHTRTAALQPRNILARHLLIHVLLTSSWMNSVERNLSLSVFYQ